MAIAGFDQARVGCGGDRRRQAARDVSRCRPRPILAYNSCGLGLMADRGALAEEAEQLLARGFGAVKLRLGYPTLEEDLAAVLAVRKRIGPHVAADGRLQPGARVSRKRCGAGACWKARTISTGSRSRSGTMTMSAPHGSLASFEVPIQIGENFSMPAAMQLALQAKARRLHDARS